MNRRHALYALASSVLAASHAGAAPAVGSPQDEHHTSWVSQVLIQMQTVKPGMTRADLLKVFTTEGGLSTGLRRTYVSRQCPFFKVDVLFRAVGRPERDRDGRVTLIEDGRDVITSVSKPYLAFSVMD